MRRRIVARALGCWLAAWIAMGGAWAQTTGTIRGIVKDPSGAVVAGAKVTATLQETKVTRTVPADEGGVYEFPTLPVGHYTIEVEVTGFKKYIQSDVELTLGHVVIVDAIMQLGAVTEEITTTAEAPLIESTSTQLGAVVNERSVTQLPLNTRDTYQLLQLQPGVQSQQGSDLFYGSDQPGVVSVNGGRGRSNNYMVNGGDANDQFVNAPVVQPSPDAIEEFRVLTNTFDSEFGRNSGAVVNVVTKSGTNTLHGHAFEFFRNRVLNSRNFFDIARGDFKQNQFGGTLGGPIKKDRTFFFESYEGRRIRQGIPSPRVAVPTPAERGGDFSAGTFNGSLTTSTVANALETRCGSSLSPGGQAALTAAINTFNTTGIFPGVPYGTLFPGSVIPTSCFDPTAADLMNQYVPVPNIGSNLLETVPTEPIRADQFSTRIDHKINDLQELNFYYFFNDDNLTQPFAPFQAAGANVPGFGAIFKDRFQQWNLTHTWTISPTAVNEARFIYFREGQLTFNHPANSHLLTGSCTAAVPAGQCFADPSNPRLGITPGLGPTHEGLPYISVSGGFIIGNNFEGELPQVANVFQWADNFTKVVGKHSLKFGGDIRRQRFDQLIFFDAGGEYLFLGGGVNDPCFGGVITNGICSGQTDLFSNYLLGLPDTFLQSGPEPENLRYTSAYLYAQDSWKVQPNVTLNYGLRWEVNQPLADTHRRLQTFRPGQPTTVFPCQLAASNPLAATFGTTDCSPTGGANAIFPLGMVFPGDKGVPSTITQTYFKSFAPRIGLAWSPGGKEGLGRALTGGPGKTSVRMGWGLFYNPVEQLVLEQGGGAPFGGVVTLSSVLFNTPFEDQFGTIHPNSFGGIRNPARGQPIDFSVFRPDLLFGTLPPKQRSQYAAQYNFNIQRELMKDLVLQVGYVGSQGHRLLGSYDLNPGNAQTCLDIINILGPGFCGPFFEDFPVTIPAGSIPAGATLHLPYGSVPTVTGPNANPITLVGLRPYSSPLCQPTTGAGCPPDGTPVFSNIFTQDGIVNSSYNSLQTSVEKRFSKGLQFLAAYTWSKSFDAASSFENELNPLCFRCARALSLFNAPHRFVFSYVWELPGAKRAGAAGRLVNGWTLSGIVSFQSGFPIRITSSSDTELQNSFDFETPGEPDLIGKFKTQDPRKTGCAFGTGPTASPAAPCTPISNQFFDPNSFAFSALGTVGNSSRSLCCGPGINNFDFSLHKDTPITEKVRTEFRAEFFNALNHAQFQVPDGNITDGSTFGEVLKARDPRLIQFALKFIF